MQLIVAAAYTTGVVTTNDSVLTDILLIGLGGGSINNYLRYTRNNVSTTTKSRKKKHNHLYLMINSKQPIRILAKLFIRFITG